MRKLVLTLPALALALAVAGCAPPGGSYRQKDHAWGPDDYTSTYQYGATGTYGLGSPRSYDGRRYANVYGDRRPVVREQVVTRTYYTYPSGSYGTYPYATAVDRYDDTLQDEPMRRQEVVRTVSQQGYTDIDHIEGRDGDYFVSARDDLGRAVVLRIDGRTGRVIQTMYQ